MTKTQLGELAKQIPTPSYIFDTDEFARRVSLVKSAFSPKTKICFSIKANPFLLNFLPCEFDKIEVCSPGELTICEKLGIDMKKVIFSGVNKTQKDVDRAMLDNAGIFTAESLLHIKLINTSALSQNKRVPVLLRLEHGSQFGMEETLIFDIIKNRNLYSGIDFVGIHFFTGTQKKKASIIEKELNIALSLIKKIENDLGYRLEKLEYGTGLAIDYFCENPEDSEKERLEAISPKISEVSEQVDLTIEMGRFFAAPCGHYITKVIDTKTNSGTNYAILDGGLNQLKYDGQIQGMQIPDIAHVSFTSDNSKEKEKWTLCGSLCTTADVLARNVELSNLSIGDILVFNRTGAYSAMEGMAIFLSREMPCIFSYSQKDGLQELRPMIYTDVFNTPQI